VSVHSELGKGSTFVMELPIASDSDAGAHEGARSPIEAGL
jgi:hypothetical protein